MSFWNLVNGRGHNLVPPQEPSKAGVVGSAMVAAVPLIAAPAAVVASVVMLSAGIGVFPVVIAGRQLWGLAKHGHLASGHEIDSAYRSEQERTAERRMWRGIDFLARASKASPKNPVTLRKLAVAYASANRDIEALECWDRLTGLSPKDQDGWTQKGLLYLAKADYVRATESLEQAVRLGAPTLDACFSLGLAERGNGNTESARLAFAETTTKYPTFAPGWYNLAQVLAELHESELSRGAFARAFELDPRFPPPWKKEIEAAKEELSRGSLDAAGPHYANALELNPDDAEICADVGAYYRACGRVEQALTMFEKATTLNPHYVKAWIMRARGLEQVGRPDDAKKCWQQAFILDVQSRVPWADTYRSALNELATGNSMSAIRGFDEVLAECPSSIEARRLREKAMRLREAQDLSANAIALMNSDKSEEAIQMWRRALEIYPELEAGWVYMGAALADRGELEGALSAFTKARALGSNSMEVRLAAALAKSYSEMDPAIGPKPIDEAFYAQGSHARKP